MKPQSFTIDYNRSVSSIIIDVGIAPFGKPEDLKDSDVVKLQSLWDTGATHSVVTKSTAAKLGLKSIGKANVQHAGGSMTTNRFLVYIFLPNRIRVTLAVTECDDSSSFGIIIGMDVIGKGDFSVTSIGGKTTVSFRMPSVERIDFTNRPIDAIDSSKTPAPIKKQPRNESCACGSGKKFKNCHGANAF